MKVLTARLGKAKLRWAMVGEDVALFAQLEAMRDFGFEIRQHFENNPKDIYHPAKPSSELVCSDYDAIVVCGNDATIESNLSDRVSRLKASQRADTPVFRISYLRRRIDEALAAIEGRHCITSLNTVKLVVVAMVALLTRGQGCIIEAGSYLGGTAILMGTLLRLSGDPRTVHCIDTYEGMPSPTEKDGQTIYQQGLFRDNRLDLVQSYVNAENLSERRHLAQRARPAAASGDSVEPAVRILCPCGHRSVRGHRCWSPWNCSSSHRERRHYC